MTGSAVPIIRRRQKEMEKEVTVIFYLSDRLQYYHRRRIVSWQIIFYWCYLAQIQRRNQKVNQRFLNYLISNRIYQLHNELYRLERLQLRIQPTWMAWQYHRKHI